MKVLNLKDMPMELMKGLKICAIERDMTIRELIISVLEGYLQVKTK